MTHEEEPISNRSILHTYPTFKDCNGLVSTPSQNERDLRASLGIDLFSAWDYGPQALQSGIMPDNMCKYNPINQYANSGLAANIDVSNQVSKAREAINSITKNDNNG